MIAKHFEKIIIGVITLIVITIVGFLLNSWLGSFESRFQGLEDKLATVETQLNILDDRSKKGQWTDSLIISNLAEIKQELKK